MATNFTTHTPRFAEAVKFVQQWAKNPFTDNIKTSWFARHPFLFVLGCMVIFAAGTFLFSMLWSLLGTILASGVFVALNMAYDRNQQLKIDNFFRQHLGLCVEGDWHDFCTEATVNWARAIQLPSLATDYFDQLETQILEIFTDQRTKAFDFNNTLLLEGWRAYMSRVETHVTSEFQAYRRVSPNAAKLNAALVELSHRLKDEVSAE